MPKCRLRIAKKSLEDVSIVFQTQFKKMQVAITDEYVNKASRPTMRPRRSAKGGVRCAVVAAVVMVVVAVVVLVVVGESHGMILCLKIFHFKRFLKKVNGHTDGRTDPLIEMRGQTSIDILRLFGDV